MDMMVLPFLVVKKVACFAVHVFVFFDRFAMIITFFSNKKGWFKNMIWLITVAHDYPKIAPDF